MLRITISQMLGFTSSDLISCKLPVSSNTFGGPWPRYKYYEIIMENPTLFCSKSGSESNN